MVKVNYLVLVSSIKSQESRSDSASFDIFKKEQRDRELFYISTLISDLRHQTSDNRQQVTPTQVLLKISSYPHHRHNRKDRGTGFDQMLLC